MRSKITNRLVALFLLATACGGRQIEGTDGNTHWLECEDDSDCTNYSCLDGYCRPESALSYPPGESTVSDDADTPEPDNEEDSTDESPTLSSYASDVPGALGAACIPSEEYSPDFSGFSHKEVSLSPSDQCDSNLCLVNKFQGRVTCPYGQGAYGDQEVECATADGASSVTVDVQPQIVERRPENSVYCSCRCDGPDPTADYCECGDGFECAELVPASVPGQEDRVGSYCVVAATNPNVAAINMSRCQADGLCEDSEHYTPEGLGVSPTTPTAAESVQVLFDLILWNEPDVYSCMPRKLPVTMDETGVPRAACRMFETFEGNTQDCERPGRRPVSDQEANFVQERLDAGHFYCDGSGCSQATVCELDQLVEEAGSEGASPCLNDEETSGEGWCYLDPSQGMGSESLISECPESAPQRLRGSGSALTFDSLKFVYCVGSF